MKHSFLNKDSPRQRLLNTFLNQCLTLTYTLKQTRPHASVVKPSEGRPSETGHVTKTRSHVSCNHEWDES